MSPKAAEPYPIRIVFLGQPGTRKATVLRALEQRLLAHPPYPDERMSVSTYFLEDEAEFRGTSALLNVFRTNRQKQRELWRAAFHRLRDRIVTDNKRIALIGLRGCYLHRREYFSLLDWDELLQLRPTAFVTLIDDVYDMVIRVRSDKRAGDTDLRDHSLVDALVWRAFEVQLGETLAKNLYLNPLGFGKRAQHGPRLGLALSEFAPPHFVFAVKHSVDTLYGTLFQRDRHRVYASFPITQTRNVAKRRAEIDKHRKWLHGNLVVYDPLAIDELRMAPSNDATRVTGLRPRWSLGDFLKPIVPAERERKGAFRAADLAAARPLILGAIRARDFKLVLQASLLAVYRPLWGGKSHGGVEREMQLANQAGREIVGYLPDGDFKGGRSGGATPFPQEVTKRNDVQNYHDLLLEREGERKANVNHGTAFDLRSESGVL